PRYVSPFPTRRSSDLDLTAFAVGHPGILDHVDLATLLVLHHEDTFVSAMVAVTGGEGDVAGAVPFVGLEGVDEALAGQVLTVGQDRKSTRLNSSHVSI